MSVPTGLTTRLRNCLAREGLTDLHALRCMDQDELRKRLMRSPYFGEKCWDELQAKLTGIGFVPWFEFAF